MVITTPAPFTSQACSCCGHTHSDNRQTQSEFICQSCGHHENADTNAAKNIRNNGIKQLLSGEFKIKSVKRCKITKSKVGQELSEPSQDHIKTHTLVEKVLDDCGIALHSLSSLKQETPSSAYFHAS
jgi:putative transposase